MIWLIRRRSFRRTGVAGELLEVSTARDDVGVRCRGNELGNHARLVLAVTVDRHQHVVSLAQGKIEGRLEGRAVTAVLRMRQHSNVASGRQHLGGAVARTIVDHQCLAAMAEYLVQDGRNMADFVINGQCRERSDHHFVILGLTIGRGKPRQAER